MNAPRSALVGAAVLFIAIVATGGVAGADPVTLTVSVADEDGDAVGDVAVEAAWETESGETGTATGTTASNGNVLLDVPEGASVELDVDDGTYVRNRPLRIANASAANVELGVSRSGTATVTVVDERNRSQADARVTVREDGRAIDRGETGSDGVYETARLERGTYEVTVVKPGYLETEREVTVTRNAETTVAIERGTVTLDVRTFDDHFDPPAPIETGSIRVDSSVYDGEVSVTEGTASLNVPVNAAYTIAVVKDGYDATPKRLWVRESPVSTNVTARRTPTLSVAPANERVLVGETTRVTVRNAYDEPAAGVTVEVDDEAVGETDDRGEADVPISSAGNRTIVARDGDVTSDPVTIEGVETADGTDPGENGSGENDTDDGDGGVSDDGDGNASDDDAGSGSNDAEDGDPGSTDDGVPGFGVVAAVLALLAAGAAGAAGRLRGQ
ncbi:Carboxypeptidase regulatory-like domain-containing protein [Halorubrum aquaticum]|uniref:Carboxypeptidase regulatory-like domain-containing protein n=1 Tax=Halorubrum aquaticum TaxID=387340 RepID=A0A1I3BGB9_9EURY|nr:carboxypeptidase-like regulatory domain-containing protein [Halorubrum aquaticum]SFH61323.1 Carboxypeptidase regulatory-like domain-containing protein [Halorubrum aquaticum]